MGWCYLYLAAGAGAFIATGVFTAGGYFTAKTKTTEKKEKREISFWGALAAVCIVAGVILSWRSLAEMHAITIGKAGTPGNLNRSTFYRALSTGENLKGDKFINAQNAADEVFLVKSSIKPPRGAFLMIIETPTGPDLKIVEPNSPVSK